MIPILENGSMPFHQVSYVKPIRVCSPHCKSGNRLEGFAFWEDHYLLSIDGAEYFSSNEVRCDRCYASHHRDGITSYCHQHLSTVTVHLLMLVFLIDQIQQRCCRLFNRAVESAKSKSRFWYRVRGLFQYFLIPGWEAMYSGIADGLASITIQDTKYLKLKVRHSSIPDDNSLFVQC
ncbi:MAG: hypothetical protein KUG79_07515 [Pseudomonadales bacterium]|nr:hypothetical protein [Pseudomonadales bacterium]